MSAPRKSHRQRRKEIRSKRLARAERLRRQLSESLDIRLRETEGWIEADPQRLATLNNTCNVLPSSYVDVMFRCRDCGGEEVWTARQQRWWYEIVGASIWSTAVRCGPCRRELRRQHSQPGADRLRQETTHLRALAEQVPDAAAWASVEAGLASKWSGVRAVAMAALAHWRSDEALARLRAVADGLPAKDRFGAEFNENDAFLRALVIGAREQDTGWILDWLISHKLMHWHVMPALPPRAVAGYADKLLAAADPAYLCRALPWLARFHPEQQPDGFQQRLRQHPDPEIAQTARKLWRLPDGAVRKM